MEILKSNVFEGKYAKYLVTFRKDDKGFFTLVERTDKETGEVIETEKDRGWWEDRQRMVYAGLVNQARSIQERTA